MYIEEKKKRIRNVRIVKGLKRINFILLIFCIILNGLIMVFMLFNFNVGVVIFFILNLYNMFILLFKYWREKKNVKSSN